MDWDWEWGFTDANGPTKKRDEVKCPVCDKKVDARGVKQHIIAVHGGTTEKAPQTPAAPAEEKE